MFTDRKKITHTHATASLAEVIRRLLFFDCFFKTLHFGLHMVIFILTYLTNSVFETGSGGTGNTLVICNFCYDLMAGNGSLCIYIYIFLIIKDDTVCVLNIFVFTLVFSDADQSETSNTITVKSPVKFPLFRLETTTQQCAVL